MSLIEPSAGAPRSERVTFGGGCFWCLEAVFEDLRGVSKVTSGYSGGKNANPTYEQVCSGTSGHAEVVQIEFDPSQIAYKDLMKVFFTLHDPTTLNRQGNDVGTQYRSVIFYESPQQKQSSEEARKEAQSQYSSPIVTEISPLTKFYPAEDYHQGYYKLNPKKPYCGYVIAPKVQKLRKTFGHLLNSTAKKP